MLTAGSLLKKERLEKDLSLEEVSAATKIHINYLEALESDNFDKFPSPVFAKGFLQSYAKFLEINVDRVVALYRRSIGEMPQQEVKLPDEPIKKRSFVITPGVIIIGIIALIVVLTFAYLIYQFYNFQKPPLLKITSPEGNVTVEEPQIDLQGTTDPGMFVTINDEPVKVSQTGNFEATLGLSLGANSVIVKARHPDNIGKEAVVTLNIEYDAPEKETEDDSEDGNIQGENGENNEPEEVEPLTEFTLELSIGAENAWVEVEVDGQQVYASVAPAQSTYSYTAEKSIYVRTGKASSTSIIVNGEKEDLIIEGGGVASVLCELEENTINCRQP